MRKMTSSSRARYAQHMPPKTPKDLREQVEAQNEQPATPGHERTAEGMEARTPSRREFFGNLRKVARKPLPRDGSSSPEK
jgi:hypothetical protein